MRRRALLLAATTAVGCSPQSPTAQRWPAPPAIDPEGRLRALHLVADQPTLVHLWARWCAPCRRELPSLQRAAPQLAARRIALVMLALEADAFALREYLADLRIGLPVWRLPAAPANLPLPALPMTLVVDAKGWIVQRHLGALAWDAPDRLLPAV